MPVVAFMSFGGALLAMWALAALVIGYVALLTWWWRERVTWAAVVLLVVPALLALWIWWDLRQGQHDHEVDE